MVDFNVILQNINDWIVASIPKITVAVITLFIGWKLIGFFIRMLNKAWKKKRIDPSLRHFLEKLISGGLKILLLVSVASMMGFATTSFIAIIGAAGLAVGLALQGSLANFAGGVLILMFKPFNIGEFIETQGHSGTVKHIDIFNTILTTPDNKTIILPNGAISNGSIVNYSREEKRRVDITIGISYNDDAKKAEKLLLDIATKHKLVLKNPEPFVRLNELGDNSVNFAIRIWTKRENYWSVYFDMMDTIKYEFDKEGISFPYPQMDIHMQK